MHEQDALHGTLTQKFVQACGTVVSKASSHLAMKRGLVSRPNQFFKSVAYEVTASPGYVLIGFDKAGWGAHAVAAHIRGDGSVAFMDPNAGEWELADDKAFYKVMSGEVSRIYRDMKLDYVNIQTFNRPG